MCMRQTCKFCIYPSIIIWSRVSEAPKFPSPWPHQQALNGGFQGAHRPELRYNTRLVLGLPLGLLPVILSGAWNTSTGSFQRSSSSTPSPFLMTELLTLFLSATVKRKHFSAACIRNLVLSVMTHPSWPKVRVGTKMGRTSRSTRLDMVLKVMIGV